MRRIALDLGLLVLGTAALSADFNRFLNLVIVDYGTGIRVAAPTAVLSFMTNAARNGIANAEFRTEDLFEPARFGRWAEAHYDLVLLDPPRAGAQAIVGRVAHWRARRVVYISCHPGSLARDAGILVETQGFELRGAGVIDMFPHTTHVESIAVFERRG